MEGFTPITFQVRSQLETVSDNTKRALKRKFDQGVKAFSGVLAKTLCPGQSMEELLQRQKRKKQKNIRQLLS